MRRSLRSGGDRTIRHSRSQDKTKKKAPRLGPRRLLIVALCGWSERARSVRLLDRGDLPVAAPPPHERPDLGDLPRLLPTFHEPPAGTIERGVDEREAKRHRRELGLALAPGFRQVALQELDAGDLVDHAAGAVLV